MTGSGSSRGKGRHQFLPWGFHDGQQALFGVRGGEPMVLRGI
jgi:hypothetical protein